MIQMFVSVALLHNITCAVPTYVVAVSRYHTINGFLVSLHEVKMLAKLNHPNIVSYKTAWLEPMAVPVNGQVAKEDGSDKSDNVTSYTDTAAAGR
jgi:hypothetical protein